MKKQNDTIAPRLLNSAIQDYEREQQKREEARERLEQLINEAAEEKKVFDAWGDNID